ncbi:MAG: to N-acetylmuramoyl-L-alanine amidase lysozyme [Phycisphaerales bacterium]|nr:to N-acetylmuramoyl-L-alanine amidase lysozyme [Phycisphaerales bacterium]
MAKWYLPLVVAGLFVVAGCQDQQAGSSVVTSLPQPSFTGPNMQPAGPAPAMAYAPQPAPIAPAHVATPASHVGARGDVPAGWVPVAATAPNQWQWIVIHHSATPTGGAAAFDKMHRAKGWDELGYHFVIGNGTDTRDGQVEVGSRWPKQKWGAHAKTPSEQYNQHGIGICLVGNFDVSHPTDAQMKSLAKLTSYLMKTYHISPEHVLGHRDTKSTDCPGRNLNVALVRRMSMQMLADAGEQIPADAQLAAVARGELLTDEKKH